ncbi:hypothetical protein V2J09_020101 [Rumex salicifolius]
MAELALFSSMVLFLLPLLFIFLIQKLILSTKHKIHETATTRIKSYPIIGSILTPPSKMAERVPWFTAQLKSSPTSTVIMKMPFGNGDLIETANPAIVEHILKTKFTIYQKGEKQTVVLHDFLGHGIFNVDGDEWKFQRRVASHEFSNKSVRKFVEQVVDTELEDRLIPILNQSVDTGRLFDLQNLLRRFTFDNICKIAFGYDPALLLPSLPESPFAAAFEEAVAISSIRFRALSPMVWRIKRFFDVGSERRLRIAASKVRDFAAEIVKQRMENSLPESDSDQDLLSRFIKSEHSDEKFVTDIAISFILAGRDTTSAALTWFCWLLSKNPLAEREIVDEVNRSYENPKSSAYDDAKELVYLHAALHESMRLYPPVMVDSKHAAVDDVLPDGTEVRKGTMVVYNVYAMGRMETIWGKDWPEFRPERWLEEREDRDGKMKRCFVAKDPYSYPVFQAGPRVCLGKEMALLQMKGVVAAVLRRFRVVPAVEEGFEPVLLPYLTAEMEGAMVELTVFSPLLLFLPFLIIFITKLIFSTNKTSQNHVKSYPILGSTSFIPKGNHRLPWMTKILEASPTSTIVIKKPLFAQSVETGKVFDLQSLLRRFTFDNICKISFDYDPALLLPSLPESPFANAFEEAVAISSLRYRYFSPIMWRIKRFFNIGSEKRLREAVSTVREFAGEVIKQKKSSPESDSDLDLLSRFLKSGHSDDKFVTDIAISFILAGRDTTSAGLTWFFWLLSKNPSVEKEIVDEINRSDEHPKNSAYDNAREMVYLHAALHESLRLYPPVVADTKQVTVDDVLPDGTEVRKGTTVVYHVYCMGRMEKIWGKDWPEFRPERWLEEREDVDGMKKRAFSAKDPFSYPVFQAGPRVCLGKEMALLQMKRMAAAIIRRFRVVPAVEEGFEPVLLPYLTAVMEGGFPVAFVNRVSEDT